MNKKILGIIVLGALTLTACGKNNTSVVIELPGNATTGYTWSCTSNDDKILELKNSNYEPNESSENEVGVGGTSKFTFEGTEDGETGVECIYKRSWEEEKLYEITYNFKVSNKEITLVSSNGNTGEDFIIPTPKFK